MTPLLLSPPCGNKKEHGSLHVLQLRTTIAPNLRGLRKLSEDAPQSSQRTPRKRQRKEICETISERLSLASVSSVRNAPNILAAAAPRWALRELRGEIELFRNFWLLPLRLSAFARYST